MNSIPLDIEILIFTELITVDSGIALYIEDNTCTWCCLTIT